MVSLYIDASKVAKAPCQTSAEIITTTSWVKCMVGCRVYAMWCERDGSSSKGVLQ